MRRLRAVDSAAPALQLDGEIEVPQFDLAQAARYRVASCQGRLDWQAAGLVKQSVLNPVFTTIEQHLVIRTMGRLNAADDKTLCEVIADVIG